MYAFVERYAKQVFAYSGTVYIGKKTGCTYIAPLL
jgi:hypothetical protein